MDASKITELLQKQNTVYLNRSNTVDSSTMTWMNQIQSSKYIKGVATCTGLQNTDVPTQAVCPNGDGTFNFGGRGKGTALATGSSQQFLNVYSGAAGSAAEIYSSDKILLQKAGRNLCAGMITDQDAYTVLPSCFTVNTNGPTPSNPNPTVNNQDTNPYLPPFDTYYQFKNPPPPVVDQNQKHYVQSCNGCVVEPVVTRYGWPIIMFGTDGSLIISNSISYIGNNVYVTGTYSGTINVYDGQPSTSTAPPYPAFTMTSTTSNLNAFVIKYDSTGKALWMNTILTTNGTQTTAYQVATDASGVYVMGYMDGTIVLTSASDRSTSFTAPVNATQSSLTTSTSALFLVKYDPFGALIWNTMVDQVLNQSSPNGNEIQPTNMGGLCTDGTNVYLCNSIDPTLASVNIYSSNGNMPPTSYLTLTSGGAGNSQQAFLVQYNAISGVTNWATAMTGDLTGPGYAGTSSAYALVCDSSHVYMTGFYNNTMNCYNAVTPASPSVGASQARVQNGSNNGMYITAYNTAGTFLWINVGNTSSNSFIPGGVQLTVDTTGLYALVPFPDTISFTNNPTPPGGGSYLQLRNTGGPSTYNMGIVKYTLTGSLVWINKILNIDNGGGNISNNGFSLSSDGSALYVTGGFGLSGTIGLYNSSTSGDPAPQAATLNTAGGTNGNAFLVKYNLLGGLQWSTIIGRNGSFAYGYSVVAETNLIYLTGTANGPVDVYNANGLSQPTTIGKTLTPDATSYFYTYLIKYSYGGQVQLS